MIFWNSLYNFFQNKNFDQYFCKFYKMSLRSIKLAFQPSIIMSDDVQAHSVRILFYAKYKQFIKISYAEFLLLFKFSAIC